MNSMGGNHPALWREAQRIQGFESNDAPGFQVELGAGSQG